MGKKDEKKAAENIRVIVRCRPLNSKEKDAGAKSCVEMETTEQSVQVNHVVGAPDKWTFDAVVNNSFTQKDVFTQFILPMADSVMDGFNATVFAYGQSGSGKTHTMSGKLDDPELQGITPRTFAYIFEQIKQMTKTHPNRIYNLSCTFAELYNGKVRDLLAKQQVTLSVKENKDKSFFVQGIHQPAVKFPEDLIRHMDEGTERRQVASTELNADSSRSHSIFTLVVEMVETSDDGDTRSVTSKFNLVDLAGSERQGKTQASGDTLKEGCNINLSLSALGTVIDTIVKGKGHVPFRSSPLTMLLKDSLGGNSKTCMFANINPSDNNLSETVSTLRFADRAKQIKNKPAVNMDTKDQKIAELSEQVAALKDKLKLLETGGMKEMEEELETLRERVGELEVDLDNAVKGREADAMDSKERHEQQQQQLQEALDAKAALDALLEERAAELQLSQQQVADEKAQRDELWAACKASLGDGLDGIDALTAKLRVLDGAVSAEDHRAVVAELRKAEVEHKAAVETHQAELAQVIGDVSRYKDEAEQLAKKLEKMKEKLDKERDAKRAAPSGGVAALGSSPALGTSGLGGSGVHATIDASAPASPSKVVDRGNAQGGDAAAVVPGDTTPLDSTARSIAVPAAAEAQQAVAAAQAAAQIAAVALGDADREELGRLRQQLTAPADSDTDVEKQLREELAARDQRIVALAAQLTAALTAANAAQASADHATVLGSTVFDPSVAEACGETPDAKQQNNSAAVTATTPRCAQGHADLHAAVAQAQALTVDVERHREEAEAAKAELAEEVARREGLANDLQGALAEATARQQELSATQLKVAELEAAVADAVATRERVEKDGADHATVVSKLETIAKERADQARDLREAAEKQRKLLTNAKAKSEGLASQLAEAKKELRDAEVRRQEALEERDASFQRALNKKLEEASDEAHKALARRDEDVKAAKKKTKKINEKLSRLKEEFDAKLCECAELTQLLEENKVEGLRAYKAQREAAFGASPNDQRIQAEQQQQQQQQRQIGDALTRAKEERRKKRDQFASGEVKSALADLRGAGAAGSGAAHARMASRQGSRPVTTTPGEEDPLTPSPPPGYQVGKAVAVGGAGGGVGFSSYVPEAQRRPPTAIGGAGAGYGGPSGGHHHGASGNGDMYDF